MSLRFPLYLFFFYYYLVLEKAKDDIFCRLAIANNRQVSLDSRYDINVVD